MNLKSCTRCAVVIDLDHVKFPEDGYDDDGSIDPSKAAYDQDTGRYRAYVPCPVCKSPIFGDVT